MPPLSMTSLILDSKFIFREKNFYSANSKELFKLCKIRLTL